jgi:phosphomannomutase
VLRLGKDGWQAVISEEFTFDNVRKIATAVAVYLINNDLVKKPVVVGYDARFLSDKAAETVIKVMQEAGRSFFLVDRDVPLPVIEWEIKDRGAACALMVTGGGQPAQYSGLKLLPGPDLAKKKNIKDIDRYLYLSALTTMANNPDPDQLAYLSGLSQLSKNNLAKSRLERFDPRERYSKYAGAQVDKNAIGKARLKVVVDPMFGSGRSYLDRLLQQLGCQVEEIRNYRDVLFGGGVPDPAEANLAELKTKVAENQADLGFALSGDAGDFAVITGGGQYFPSAHFAQWQEAGSLLACLRIVELAARKGLKALA